MFRVRIGQPDHIKVSKIEDDSYRMTMENARRPSPLMSLFHSAVSSKKSDSAKPMFALRKLLWILRSC